MKKLFFSFIAVFAFALTASAQEAVSIAKSEGKVALEQSKSSGSYMFEFPADISDERVVKSTGYYESYFAVDYDEEKNIAKIKLVYNEVDSRVVIMRFLVASGITHVEIDGTNITVYEFLEQYLQ